MVSAFLTKNKRKCDKGVGEYYIFFNNKLGLPGALTGIARVGSSTLNDARKCLKVFLIGSFGLIE